MFALLLARDQKYLCLLEAGESGRMFSSQIPDELKLVAHPLGRAKLMCNLQLNRVNFSHDFTHYRD
jgi:hypothetical protein